MRIFVMGATGGIGRLVLEQAIERGHFMSAYVRSPEKVELRHERLMVCGGDSRDAEGITKNLPGHDAIICSVGHKSSADTTLLQDSARAIIQAMMRTNVRRVLVVSVAFLFPETGVPGALLRKVFLRSTGKDAAAMEGILMREPLDWTIVRPPRLTNGGRTGQYRVLDGHLPKRGFVISRADVADFLLNETEQPKHIRQIVGVCK
jgi:putative NADH-flavin reductase